MNSFVLKFVSTLFLLIIISFPPLKGHSLTKEICLTKNIKHYPVFTVKTYRITAVLKVETDIIASISVSPVGGAVILVIISVNTFKTDVIVSISDIIMCFDVRLTDMRVTN